PPWFSAAVEAGEGVIVMTEPYWSQAAQTFTAGIATWLPELNNVGAVVGISVTQYDVFNRIAHDPVLGDGYRILVARGGNIILHSNEVIAEDESIQTIIDLPGGELIAENLRERYRITRLEDEIMGAAYYVSARLPTVGWTLLDVIPATEVEGPISRSLLAILIPVGVLFAFVFSVVLYLFYTMLKHREKLNKAEKNAIQKKEQERLNERIQLVIDSAPICVTTYTPSFELLECNEECVRMFEFENKNMFIEAFNSNPEGFYPPSQPNGLASPKLIAEAFEQAKGGGGLSFELVHRTAKGEDFPTMVTLVRVNMHDSFIFVAYVNDLREIKKLEKQRLQALEESGRAKDRFLARMSHEIRTPITAVLGLTEIQLRSQQITPPMEEVFIKIYDSSKILLHIVNDILDFSKIESGEMPLINNEYDIATLISDAALLHLIYLESKNISFKMRIDENLPTKLIGDVVRIRQIVSNLLNNAFKYTESGTVTFSLECEQQADNNVMLIMTIQDTGHGMTFEQTDIIKGEYIRLRKHEESYTTGTGLGLPIVYSLAELMNAQVDLQSNVGSGTHVTIRIPQEQLGDAVLGKEFARKLQDFESGIWSISKDFDFVPELFPNGNVLVVDDVDTNLYVAEAMLESFGLNIELCESGYEAIEKIKAGKVYDIIFMDHMMPGIDGMETTKIMREMGYTHPIVALTANAVKGQSEVFMQNGFSGFISKPIDIKLLNAYLVRFVKE
ncbi:MAG: response regulator, partial [Defluviitaleaceae bacterium]|nr:response regulator [Defluviitaleaceae bacterium]